MHDCKNGPAKRALGLSCEAWLFLLAFGLEVWVFLWLTLNQRISAGHDTWQYFLFRYYFLNGAATSGEIPQWFPYLAQGTVATWFYQYSGGLLQNILLYLAPLLRGFNFLPIFYATVLADEFLLLLGMWLWARRFLQSPLAVFFVTLSVMASCVWFNQPWFNLRLYAALPLIIHFVHEFLERGRFRDLFFAGNLAAFQTIGSMPYFLPFLSWLGFVYFACYGACNLGQLRESLSRIRFISWPALLCLLGVGISLGAAFAATSLGTSDMLLMHRSGSDFTVDLKEFLTYADNFRPINWAELVLRSSPVMDWSVYLGISALPLCVLGLGRSLKRQNLQILLSLILLLAFANATLVSKLAYHLWPMMKYFRHISYVSLVGKLFLALLAGFGVEELLSQAPQGAWSKRLGLLACLLCALICAALFAAGHNPELMDQLLNRVFSRMTNKLFYPNNIAAIFLNPARLTENVRLGSLLALGVLAVLSASRFARLKKHALWLAAILLCLQVCDVYSYRFSELSYRTLALEAGQYKSLTFQDPPYRPRREAREPLPGPRAQIAARLPLIWGVEMWFSDAFTFTDRVRTPYKTQYWHAPLSDFMGSFSQGRLAALYEKYYHPFPLPFPLANPVAAKLGGVSAEKLQVFDQAIFLDTRQQIRLALGDPAYLGDTPLLLKSPLENNPDYQPKVTPRWKLKQQSLVLNMDTRQAARPEIKHFDSNNLRLEVDAAPGQGGWLYYADLWHPWWRATVNGQDAYVYQASLAYKAVRLEPGHNEVLFRLHSPWLEGVYRFFAACSCLWIFLCLRLSLEIVRPKP